MSKLKGDIHSIVVDGNRYIVCKMYDIDGDETEDPDMAFTCTAQKGLCMMTIQVNARQGIQTE